MKKICLLLLSIMFFLGCMAQEKQDSIPQDSTNTSSKMAEVVSSGNQNVENIGLVSILLISTGVSLVVGFILGGWSLFLVKSSNSGLNKRIDQRKSAIKSLEGRLDSIDQKIARLEFEFKKPKTGNLDNSKSGETKNQKTKNITLDCEAHNQNTSDVKMQRESSTPESLPTNIDSQKEKIEDSEVIKKCKKKLYADSPGEGGDVFRDVFTSPKNSSMFMITYCEGETTGEFTLMDSAAAINRFIESIDVHSKNTANYVGSGMTINQDFTVPGTVELTPDKKWQIKEKMNLKFE